MNSTIIIRNARLKHRPILTVERSDFLGMLHPAVG